MDEIGLATFKFNKDCVCVSSQYKRIDFREFIVVIGRKITYLKILDVIQEIDDKERIHSNLRE